MSNYSLVPTLENTIYLFVNNIIPSLKDKENTDVDIRFEFLEDEVKKLNLNNDEDINDDTNVIKVRDYKKFFNLLKEVYECDIDAFEKYEKAPYTYSRMNTFFKDLWVRATNLDFDNIEEFLEKQIEMYKDNTFYNFDEEQRICNLDELDDLVFSIKNKLAKTWDETPYEISFRFYDDYYVGRYFGKTYYELPKVRYGIYEKDGEKIARVGSIQNNIDRFENDDFASKKINRFKYKLVDNREDFKDLEPNKVLSFMLFIKLLKEQGIDKVELPSLYILDYNYHIKRNRLLDNELSSKKYYKEDVSTYESFYNEMYGEEDIVSKSKSEDLSRIGLKAKDYIDDIEVLDIDNRVLLDISKIKTKNINNRLVKYFYEELDYNKDKIKNNKKKYILN